MNIIMPRNHGRSAAKQQFEHFEEMSRMSEITRANDGTKAPEDGVALETNCSFVKFVTNGRKKQVEIKGNEIIKCKMMASYSDGTFSVSVPGKLSMVSVRLDELYALLSAASEAAKYGAAQKDVGQGEPV